MKIVNVHSYEILDSRGIPTVACRLQLEGGTQVCASVPSGSSRGKHEAIELRDGDKTRYLGNGVQRAVENINTEIAKVVVGKKPHLLDLDKELIALDGTENKSRLGSNAMLATSIAIAKAQALSNGQELYASLASLCAVDKPSVPRIMFNLINGGAHATNNLSFQEFMVMPTQDRPLAEVYEDVFLIYHNLRELLHADGHTTGTGAEGGFAPALSGEKEALDYLMKAIEVAGYTHDEYVLAIDVAGSHLYDEQKQLYTVQGATYTSDALIDYYDELCSHYPIFSIEDGLAQDDELGWSALTKRLGKRVQIVGDDLFVTNENRIRTGIDKAYANAAVIKPNQIGTVSETIAAIKLCQDSGMHTIVSHRSGETNDTFIADLAVGLHAGQFKGGAIVHGERVAKYNRLMEIERGL